MKPIYFITSVFLSIFLNISCNSKQNIYEETINKYNDSIKINSQITPRYPRALLDIKLLTSSSDLGFQLKKLMKEGKLLRKENSLIYNFNLDGENDAFGRISPVFFNDTVYSIKIFFEYYDETLNSLTPSDTKTLIIYMLYKEKYEKTHKTFYMYNEETKDLSISWIFDGMEINIHNGIITYTCLKIKKQIDENEDKELLKQSIEY